MIHGSGWGLKSAPQIGCEVDASADVYAAGVLWSVIHELQQRNHKDLCKLSTLHMSRSSMSE